MYGGVHGLSWAQRLLKKYSKFRQRSSVFPNENKKFQRQILRLTFEHPIFQFLSLPSLPYLCPGGGGGRLRWRWILARSFALISMEEDSTTVFGPLSQSEDSSALLSGFGTCAWYKRESLDVLYSNPNFCWEISNMSRYSWFLP